MSPELLKHVEILIGSVGVILGLFFSVFLFATRLQQPKANLFLSIYLFSFSLRIGKSLFHNYFEIDAVFRTGILTTLLCIGPSIWLYTLHLAKPKTSGNLNEFIHYIPFFIFISLCWMIPNNGSNIFGLFYDFLTLHMFCYVVYSLFWLIRQNKTDVIQGNPKTKFWLYLFLITNLALVVVYFLVSKVIITFYLEFSFFFSSVIIFFSFWALKNPFLFKMYAEKYKNSTINNTEAAELMADIRDLMDDEKPHLDPTLTLAELSAKLNVSTKELSQTINQIESLNYSQFISRYRVEEVIHLMKSKSGSNLTIATMAYKSGFNSISSFNFAFKKHTQKSASEYRKSITTE